MTFLSVEILFLLAASEHSAFNDPEFLLRIKQGDHQAFKQFFETNHTYLFNFLRQKGASEQAAEDLIQQAFVMIWEKRSQIDESKSLRSYLFKIAHSRLLNLFRDNAKFVEESAIPEQAEPEQADAEDAKQLNKAIERAIGEMPEKRQNVFRLCFLQEFTYKEAAEVLDVSAKTIENHMALALKDLREALKGYR
ncbi:MAG: sigma-70 family RNA polymerase sigma factor [Bacteroidota bacterium]